MLETLRWEFMKRLFKALLQNWCAWVVLFFSQGVKALVNQVEQPFARSLIACDVPVSPDVYTGSRWCGDRLQVIQHGQYLSAMGQGQENFAMLCSLSFVIIITGVWGPRISLTLGLFGVTMSVGLFVMASSSPAVGRSLFAMGQGLQGLYPIEYLLGILMLHMGILPNADGEANFQLMSYMGMLSMIVWQLGLGTVVQLLDLSDYTRVWVGIFCLDVVILLLTIFLFPEMRPMDSYKFEGQSPLVKVWREIASYKSLLYDWRARRYLLKMFVENIVTTFPTATSAGYLMAYHGWSQSAMMTNIFLPQLLGMMFMPFYQKVLIKRWGNYRVYTWTCRYLIVGQVAAAISLAFTDKGWLFWCYSNSLTSGFNPMKGFVDSRFAEPEQMQRFQSVQWVLGYFLGMWSFPLFASRFNAYTSDPHERLQPVYVLAALATLQYIVVFYGIFDMDGVQGFAVTVRVMDECKRKAEELWFVVGTDSGRKGEGHCYILQEQWENYGLAAILGKPWHETGGPIFSVEHVEAIIGTMNQTPSMGHECLKRLEGAIVHAKDLQAQYFANLEQQQAAAAQAAAAPPPQEPALAEVPCPELQGTWEPIMVHEWLDPVEAAHPSTLEFWDANGKGGFQNATKEFGTLRVVAKTGSDYICVAQLVSGASAGVTMTLNMVLNPDGTRSWPQVKRYLRRRVDGEAKPGGEPQEPPPEPKDGSSEPAPEGKKDA